MITISRNPNFNEWFDIRLLGKVVDNAKTRARANFLANELKKEIKESKGDVLSILNKGRD
jgi:hypothetical protein